MSGLLSFLGGAGEGYLGWQQQQNREREFMMKEQLRMQRMEAERNWELEDREHKEGLLEEFQAANPDLIVNPLSGAMMRKGGGRGGGGRSPGRSGKEELSALKNRLKILQAIQNSDSATKQQRQNAILEEPVVLQRMYEITRGGPAQGAPTAYGLDNYFADKIGRPKPEPAAEKPVAEEPVVRQPVQTRKPLPQEPEFQGWSFGP